MTLLKRVNLTAVCTSSRAEIGIGELQRWQREMEELDNKQLLYVKGREASAGLGGVADGCETFRAQTSCWQIVE
jgi:hypothetical protein